MPIFASLLCYRGDDGKCGKEMGRSETRSKMGYEVIDSFAAMIFAVIKPTGTLKEWDVLGE